MHTMDPVQGYRQTITAIDLAMLEDVGWTVDYGALPPYPYGPILPANAEVSGRSIDEASLGILSVGHWYFKEPEGVERPVRGRLLRYAPPPGSVGSIIDLHRKDEAAIRVPRGGWIFCAPELPPNGGGIYCNSYTLILDVKIPSHGVYYALYNANPNNANDADAFVNKEGLLGAGTGGYGKDKVPVDRWTRISIVLSAETRRYFIDGAFSHEVGDAVIDGRYSLFPGGSLSGYFCLFGDDDGEDADILVRRILLFDRALSDAEILDLERQAPLR